MIAKDTGDLLGKSTFLVTLSSVQGYFLYFNQERTCKYLYSLWIPSTLRSLSSVLFYQMVWWFEIFSKAFVKWPSTISKIRCHTCAVITRSWIHTLCCIYLHSLACLWSKMPVSENEGGRRAIPTSFSIFDSYDMKSLWLVHKGRNTRGENWMLSHLS